MNFKPASTRMVTLALAASLTFTTVGAMQEDGTGGTLPETLSTCEIVAAAWSPTSDSPAASPAASPVASPVVPVASPVASPVVVASPMASPIAETTPVVTDSALQQDLTNASQAILGCMSTNDVEALTKVTAPDFRGAWLGVGAILDDADFAAILPMMPVLEYSLVDVSNAVASGDSATATVRYLNGRQLHTAEWTFALSQVDGQNTWVVQSQTSMTSEAPADATTINVTISDGSFAFDTSSVTEGSLVLHVKNTGAQPHEVLIVRATPETEAADFAMAPTGLPEGSTFIGQVTVPAGTEGTIVLTDVRAGTYSVVDLLPDEAGLPNVSSGMYTTFTVNKP